jgi:hypothetical protein
MDANAAASSTNTFNIATSFFIEHKKNIVPFLFEGQALSADRLRPRHDVVNAADSAHQRMKNPGARVAPGPFDPPLKRGGAQYLEITGPPNL